MFGVDDPAVALFVGLVKPREARFFITEADRDQRFEIGRIISQMGTGFVLFEPLVPYAGRPPLRGEIICLRRVYSLLPLANTKGS